MQRPEYPDRPYQVPNPEEGDLRDQEDPDRQPRRDRRPHRARLRRDGHPLGGRLLRGRSPRAARQARRRSPQHRRGPAGRLPQPARPGEPGGGKWLRRPAPRLWLPLGKCRAGGNLRRARYQVHRPVGASDPPHGRQDRSPPQHDRRRRALHPRHRRQRRRSRRGPARSRADRLPGDAQGHLRRRRSRHPSLQQPRGAGTGVPAGDLRGDQGLRQRRSIPREVHRQSQAHRGADPRRFLRQHRAPVRTRLLDPAPQPEAHRDRPEPAAHPRAARLHRRSGGARGQGGGLRERRHRGVPARRRRGVLHGDEHPGPGGAHHHRGNHRHRRGPRADPHRFRAGAVGQAGRHRPSRLRPAVPHQRRGPEEQLPTLVRQDHPLLRPRRPRRSTPATPSRRTTTRCA